MRLPDGILRLLEAVTSTNLGASVTITPSQGISINLSSDKLIVSIRDWWASFEIKGSLVTSVDAKNTLGYLLADGTFEEFLVKLEVIRFLLNDKSAAHSISNLAKGTVYR